MRLGGVLLGLRSSASGASVVPDMADSPLQLGARVAGIVGGLALRPVSEAAVRAARAERAARAAAVERLSDATLGALDALLASRLAEQALDRVLGSALARRAVDGALEGPLVEAAARAIARHAVVERVLADGVLEQATARVLDGPELDRIAAAVIESPAMDRLVERLLESDDLWIVVDEIAHSPAVTDAITQQSIGFADQVAGGVRSRSRTADDWIEARVRRALRRPPAEGRG
jgi:hypothetical protein